MQLASAAVMLAMYASNSWAFDLNDVAKEAKSLAGQSYEAPKSNLPSQLRDLKYADYQQIQYKRDKAYWGKLRTPFKLEFYPEGMYFDVPVKVNEVTANSVREIKYSPDDFTFGNIPHDADSFKTSALPVLKCFIRLTAKIKKTKLPVSWAPAISV